MSKLGIAKRPCGSCPYRRDVPSGVWAPHEYDKLIEYDRPTWAQPSAAFLCHQRDGNLCAGWVACHGSELLGLRMEAAAGNVGPELFQYRTDVPVFASGSEAREHGQREIDNPGERARRKVAALSKVIGK